MLSNHTILLGGGNKTVSLCINKDFVKFVLPSPLPQEISILKGCFSSTSVCRDILANENLMRIFYYL